MHRTRAEGNRESEPARPAWKIWKRGEVARRAVLLGLIVFATLPASAQKPRQKYDAMTGLTTVQQILISDYPMSGPSKRLDVLYFFPGKELTAPPDTVAFMVKLSYVSAGVMSDGTPPTNPTLYFLIDDSVRFHFAPITRDWHSSLLGGLGYSEDGIYGYAMPREIFARLATATKASFRVGPWDRAMKPNDLKDLRQLMARWPTGQQGRRRRLPGDGSGSAGHMDARQPRH